MELVSNHLQLRKVLFGGFDRVVGDQNALVESGQPLEVDHVLVHEGLGLGGQQLVFVLVVGVDDHRQHVGNLGLPVVVQEDPDVERNGVVEGRVELLGVVVERPAVVVELPALNDVGEVQSHGVVAHLETDYELAAVDQLHPGH